MALSVKSCHEGVAIATNFTLRFDPHLLHFAGSMPQLHSHFSAPGVVMAVGNTGEFLDTSADVSCTYLSRDGGESW